MNQQASTWRSALWLLFAVACREGEAPKEATSPPLVPIALVEQVGSMRALIPDAPDDAPSSFPALRLDFTLGTGAELGFPKRLARVIDNPDGVGRCLAMKPHTGRPLAVMVEAKPTTFYRVRHQGRGDTVQLALVETRAPVTSRRLNASSDLNRVLGNKLVQGSYVRPDMLIARRALSRSDTQLVHTSAEARSFVLLFESQHPGEPTCFDSIGVEELQLPPTGSLALTSELLHLQPSQVVAPGPVWAPMVHLDQGGRSHRQALLLPPGGSLEFSLPAGSRFTTEVAALSAAGDAVARVWIAANGQRLWENDASAQWSPAAVDLPAPLVTLQLGVEPSAAGVMVALGAPTVQFAPSASTEAPDVIIIALDGLRADRLPFHGYERPTSPYLAELVRESVVFQRAIASSDVPWESLAAVFTSSFSGQHRVVSPRDQLAANSLTAALRAAGYATAAVGTNAVAAFARGFDETSAHRASTDADAALQATAWAVQWTEREAVKPRSLFVHLDVGPPFDMPPDRELTFARQESLQRYRLQWPVRVSDGRVTSGSDFERCGACASGGRLSRGFQRLASDLYDDEVFFADQLVGRLLSALRKQPQRYEESLIVVLSPRGAPSLDGPEMEAGTVRVPLLIKPPKRAKLAPRTVSASVRLIDVLPTLLDLLGMAVPENVQGRSMVALMAGTDTIDRPAVIENSEGDTIAWWDGAFKYVLQPRGGRPQEVGFDLHKDPQERRPLRDDVRLAPYREHIAAHMVRTRAGPFVWLNTDAVVSTRLANGELCLGKARGRGHRLWKISSASSPVLQVGAKHYELGSSDTWPPAPVAQWRELAEGIEVMTVR